jgi:hypothetical protein
MQLHDLEELMLKGHVRLGLEADAGAEDVGKSATLLGQGIDNGCARGSQGSLEHVAQDAQHTMERLEVLVALGAGRLSLPLDARHHFGDEDQVDDQRRCEEGVLTDVEDPRTGC